MHADYAALKSDDRIVARFLGRYHAIWQDYFPGLNKRAHWHVMFAARRSPDQPISCRSIHRTLYGAYGTDIRTCIERIKDCENDGFVRIIDAADQPCAASPICLIAPTAKLFENFDRHCRDTVAELYSVFDDGTVPDIECDEAVIAGIYDFLGVYDQKWRETGEFVVRNKGLTPAYVNDAMDHLVTYQYWAIVMLLWWASPFGTGNGGSHALVVDEINSRMWDVLRLGHLAIKERVNNLIRWGFFAEETIRKHKAVSLTETAGAAISKSFAATRPYLRDLYGRVSDKALAADSA
jgi:hypothetical protein